MCSLKLLKRILVGSSIKKTLIRAAILIVIVYFVFTKLLLLVAVSGPGMQPTLNDGSYHVFESVSGYLSPYKRGDVVAIRLAGRSIVYVSRVIALPRDRISIKAGKVLVNGKDIGQESFSDLTEYNEITLSENEYFVIADNKELDSKYYLRTPIFGKVREIKIIGRLLF